MVDEPISLIKACEYCQKEFTVTAGTNLKFSSAIAAQKLKRRFCSRSCASKHANTLPSLRTKNKWNKQETDYLGSLIGKYPKELIVEKMQAYQKKHQFEVRGETAVLVKAKRVARKASKTLEPDSNYWNVKALAAKLGIGQHRTRSWVERGIIEVVRSNGQDTRVTRKEFKKFAAKYSHELGGIEPKKLRAVLKDSKLANAIINTANYAPKRGRKMTIVRLDNGEVYQSAKQAAVVLAPIMKNTEITAQSKIIQTAKRNSPMRNGMDFFQLDYPLFWVPHILREEFNYLAGKVLYSLYQDICTVTGYQKQSCLTVAARLAIEITLLAFRLRKSHEEHNTDKKDLSHEAIADFYGEKFKERLFYVYQMTPGLIFKKVTFIIRKRLTKNIFAAVNGDLILFEEYCQEFANFYIRKQTEQYYRKSFLPIGYSAKTRLEIADLWAYIYGSLNLYINIGKEENNTKKSISWLMLQWIHFSKRNKIESESAKEITFNKSWEKHNQETTNKASEIDVLLANAEQIYDEQTYEKLSMFVALKLEEASDREIAECMDIPLTTIPKLLDQLKECSA